jgi:hypothetical protein
MVRDGSLSQWRGRRVYRFIDQETRLTNWSELVEVPHQDNYWNPSKRLIGTVSE